LPIVSEGSIEPEFYNKMNLPIAIIISFLIGISILLEWKSADKNRLLKKLILPFTLAVVVTLILIIFGLNDSLMVLFALAALFTFFVNLQLLIKIVKNKKFTIGAYLSHIGIALLFLGVIGSAFYSEEVNLSLELDKPTEAFGYSLTYIGVKEFIDPDNKIDTKFQFIVSVKKGNDEFELKPVMYYSEISKGIMKNPDIANLITKDLYISPISIEEPKVFSNEDIYIFKKGEQKDIKGLSIEFTDFEMEGMSMGQDAAPSKDLLIGVNLKINDGEKIMTVIPKIIYKENDEEY
jgi:cytochrome c-type biogenesis protein CcmF